MDSLDFTPWLMDIYPSQDIAMPWLEAIVPAYTQPKIASTQLEIAKPCQTHEKALYAQIVQETRPSLIKRARMALQAIPDASCDSIAAALGLSPHTVRALSKGKRLGREYYPPQEILDAVNQ